MFWWPVRLFTNTNGGSLKFSRECSNVTEPLQGSPPGEDCVTQSPPMQNGMRKGSMYRDIIWLWLRCEVLVCWYV